MKCKYRRLLEITLSSTGYKISEAATGKEGLIVAATYNPALIILDLGLPDIDGFEILKKLREWYQKPIIILSVRNLEEDIIRALDNGANDYLTKPFRTGELLARIRVALRQSQGAEDNPCLTFGSLTIDLANHIARKNEQVLETYINRICIIGTSCKKFRQGINSSEHLKRNMGIRIYWTDTVFKSIRSPASEKN